MKRGKIYKEIMKDPNVHPSAKVFDWDTYKFTIIFEGEICVDKGKIPTEEDIKTYIKEDINDLIIDQEIYEIKKV